MRAIVVVAAVMGCYAPKATPGAPCAPEAPAPCPDGEICALANGAFQCLEQAPAADAPRALDDAPRDDAPPPPPPDAPVPVVPWQLVQTKDALGSTVSIAASGDGHVIIVAIETPATATVSGVTDDAGNTYVAITRASHGVRNFAIELWYASATHANANRITVTAPSVFATVAWEVAGLGALATSAKLDDQPTSTTPLGAPVTTTAAGELVIAAAIVGNQVSGIHAGNAFTNDHTTFGNGWAHLTDAQAPPGTYQAQWDQPTSGVYCAASAAFFTP